MDSHLLNWLNLLVRCLHFTAGIAWIGASFYFNWLENTLNRIGNQKPGIAGNLWAIHGGGFYYLEKYKNAPEVIPDDLHWFKWEAYVTWLSGISLLIIVFYCNVDLLLAQQNDFGLSKESRILIGLFSPALAWFFYDCLCKTPLSKRGLLFSLVGISVLAASAFGLNQIFSGRAAYIHVGAMIGTIMVGNVFRIIIPSQKAMVAAAKLGQQPDPSLGRDALGRSRHNNYLTLPVLFIMVSGHYPITYNHQYPWAILTGAIIVGMIIKHYFNIRKHSRHGYIYVLAGCLGLMALIFVTKPKSTQGAGLGPSVSFAAVNEIITRRCIQCHSMSPTDDVFTIAPLGITFDRPEEIKANAAAIRLRVVDLGDMPLNNKTKMSDEERSHLQAWIDKGSNIEE